MPDQLICINGYPKPFFHTFPASSSPPAVSISFPLRDGLLRDKNRVLWGYQGEAIGRGFLIAPVTWEGY